MSTSLLADFNVVFGNIYFVRLFLNFPRQKLRFSASSQVPINKTSILGHFEVKFLIVCNIPRQRSLVTVTTFKGRLFSEEFSSCSQQKLIQFSAESIVLGRFRLTKLSFQDDFLKVQAKFQKLFGLLLGKESEILS